MLNVLGIGLVRIVYLRVQISNLKSREVRGSWNDRCS